MLQGMGVLPGGGGLSQSLTEKLVFRKQRREQRPASPPRGAAGPRAEASEHGKRAVGWAHGHATLDASRGRGQSLGGWCVPGTQGGPPAGGGAPKWLWGCQG